MDVVLDTFALLVTLFSVVCLLVQLLDRTLIGHLLVRLFKSP